MYEKIACLSVVPKGAGGVNLPAKQGWDEIVAAKYPHTIKTNSAAPDAVNVYRPILSKQPDDSVTIITVGFLTNLASLFNSTGDQFFATYRDRRG